MVNSHESTKAVTSTVGQAALCIAGGPVNNHCICAGQQNVRREGRAVFETNLLSSLGSSSTFSPLARARADFQACCFPSPCHTSHQMLFSIPKCLIQFRNIHSTVQMGTEKCISPLERCFLEHPMYRHLLYICYVTNCFQDCHASAKLTSISAAGLHRCYGANDTRTALYQANGPQSLAPT